VSADQIVSDELHRQLYELATEDLAEQATPVVKLAAKTLAVEQQEEQAA